MNSITLCIFRRERLLFNKYLKRIVLKMNIHFYWCDMSKNAAKKFMQNRKIVFTYPLLADVAHHSIIFIFIRRNQPKKIPKITSWIKVRLVMMLFADLPRESAVKCLMASYQGGTASITSFNRMNKVVSIFDYVM